MGSSSLLSGRTAFVVFVLALSCTVGAQQPGLRLTTLGTNQFVLQITNAVPATNYSLEWRPFLDAAQPWTPYLRGAVGQSNFTISPGPYRAGFFRASPGIDWHSNYLAGSASLPPLALNTFWDTYLGNFRVSENFVKTNA